jgi:type II secretory pathway component PulF
MKVELPLSTRLVIGTSDFTVAYYPYLAVLLVILIIGGVKLIEIIKH